ncbi:MAG: UvrD-helicase domain-containing protein [Gemmatimonadales bacterium]|nr:UvrD-helicase domain-containing protein [Gemmatimonadales bacterium]
MSGWLDKNAADKATKEQRKAANPKYSVALRASAGSGKTKVLVDRFLRLCIEGGRQSVHPRSILAVTFTRKAAVEIQKRILERATEMALAQSAELEKELTKLFYDRQPLPGELSRAAGLYELLLEDISGLNVGTIHSFCQLILNRFALDAGLDPRFTVLENRQELLDEALDQLELEMADQAELSATGQLVGDNPTSIRKGVSGLFNEQMRLQRWLDAVGRKTDPNADSMVRRPRLDLLPHLLRDLRGFLFPDLDPDTEPKMEELIPALRETLSSFAANGIQDITLGLGAEGAGLLAKDLKKLHEQAEDLLADEADPGPSRNIDLATGARSLFLTQAGQMRSFTRMRKDPGLKELFNELVAGQALPVLDVLRRMSYVELYQKNQGLLRLGLRAMDLYDKLKRRDHVVDFQDLEELARRLMDDEVRAMSLLYRLDDSITHILLDEFQDTNFNQWEILKPFVEDFLAGGSGEGKPTVFFVGDVKQSIYAFRGAEPDLFAFVERKLEEYGQKIFNLPTNFRSLGAVVNSVGCLFENDPLREHVPETERKHLRQLWARLKPSGGVSVLPPLEGDAARVAAQLVRRLVEDGETTWKDYGDNPGERPLVWDDFLVLCRQRTEIGLYEKAFRQAGIPIAPSGRGMLAASREVQDILALLRWLVFPSDDVALATVLRSPLFRLGEVEFQEVLARRGLRNYDAEGALMPPKGLWRTLALDPEHSVTGEAVRLLAGWRKHLGFGSCHDLLRRIYREGHVLERFQAALGGQARYNLLRLFDLSLGPEMATIPTVRRLAELIDRADRLGGKDEGTLPRSGDEGRVRFMTIHGAKGLEAPVVLLVDADRPSDKEGLRVRTTPDDPNTPVLFGVKKEFRHPFRLPAGMELPSDGLQTAALKARERGRFEETNLLYVALTRARDRLYILGGNKEGNRSSGTEFDSPLRKLRRAAVAAAGENGNCSDVDLEGPDWLVDVVDSETSDSLAHVTSKGTVPIEEYGFWKPPVLRAPFDEITPSGVDLPEMSASKGARMPGPDVPATLRGEEIHALLQLAADQGKMPPGIGPFHAEAAAVFGDQELTWIFRPEGDESRGLCEVPMAHWRTKAPGRIPERVVGVIDRLVLRPGRADIIDYKTNRTGGDPGRLAELAGHYRPQLELYREVIAALYPDREIFTWLLFTDPALEAAARLVEC